MSDSDLPSTAEPDQKELPPIPDGGLGKGLPAWLAAPPSKPVKPAGEPTPIDLSTLAGDTQLPQWLQDLSERVERGEGPVEGAGERAPLEQAVVAAAEPPDAREMSSEPVHEPPVVVPPPVEATPVEPPQAVVVTPEPRQNGVYLLTVLAVIVIAALAAWLIWA